MTDKTKLLDAQARARVARDVHRSTIVEAAAGTGKTTLLIQRIRTLIEQGTSLSRVVAITFTEKAARELKEKLRERLQEALHDSGEHQQRYREALAELDVMSVNTIHGFCADLIRQQPVEAGVDPDFRVLDEDGENEAREEFWADWLTQELSRECDAVAPFLAEEVTVESEFGGLSFRTIFDDMSENADTLSAFHVPTIPAEEINNKILVLHAETQQQLALCRHCSDPADKLRMEIEKLQPWVERIDENNLETLHDWLKLAPGISAGNKGSKGNWESPEILQQAREWVRGFKERRAEILRDVWSIHANYLVAWIRGAVEAFMDSKCESGLLGFQDLLIVARNLLRDNEAARRFFKQKYTYLFVDEFQDTDPLQTEIIFYLAEREGRQATDWREVDLAPGKLFIVGDPKQSIYRFRRADLELYGRVKRKMESAGGSESIHVSFRSVQPIIEEVNSIFAPLMTGSTEDRYEPEYIAMTPERAPESEMNAVELLPPPPNWDPSSINAAQAATAEAAVIAEYIVEITSDKSRHLHVNDEHRVIGYDDIAILFRSWNHCNKLEQELRARDIPYELSSGKRFGQRSEVMSLRTVLRAISNPHNETAVVGALRSSFFGCSDDALVAHKLSGGNFNYAETETAQGYLGDCFALLKELHAQSMKALPSELIIELLDRTKQLLLLALKPQGRTRINNINRLLAYVRALEADGNRSLHRIVRHLTRERAIEGAGEAHDPDAEGNCVRLMTYHKAKGLEFPVVILYGLGMKTHGADPSVYNRDTTGYEFSVRNIETAGYRKAHAAEKSRNAEEEKRLLYVAMTRARDLLALPLYWFYGKTAAPRQFQIFFDRRFPRDENGKPKTRGTHARVVDTSRYDLKQLPKEKLHFDFEHPFTDAAVRAAEREFRKWSERKDAAVRRLDRRHEFGRPSFHEPIEVDTDTPKHTKPSPDGAALGTLVHDVLEKITLPAGDNIEQLLAVESQGMGIDGESVSTARDLIRNALASDLFRKRIVNAERSFRELPFTAEINGVLYDGRMDLVFIENGRPVIVDYKTDQVTESGIDQRAAYYKSQCEIYARALETILGQPIAEVILFFLRPQKQVSFSRE